MARNADSRTAKQRNRAARQEELRKQLAAYGHHQQAVKIIEKIADVNGNSDPINAGMEQLELRRYEVALKGHLEFMKKYLPDMKAVEHSQDPDQPVMTEDQIDARLARLVKAINGAES